MDKSCVRVVAACVLSILILGAGPRGARAGSMMIESFEYYSDSNDLRSAWIIDGFATIDLTVAGGNPDKGPAQDGVKYMRVNYLGFPVVVHTDVGGADWSQYVTLRLWHRGIPGTANDVISLQVELKDSSGGSWFGDIEPDVSTCESWKTFCEWEEDVVDFSGWDQRDQVQEIRLHFWTEEGNAEFYVDSFQVSTVPVLSPGDTWGGIKSLYH